VLTSFDHLVVLAQTNPVTVAIWCGVAFLTMLVLFLSVAILKYGNLWFQGFMSQADIGLLDLVGMGLRNVRPEVIVKAKVMAKQAGVDINRRTGLRTTDLEAHYLAGGDVMRVINAIIAAQRANIDLDFDRAAAIDLAGRDDRPCRPRCDGRGQDVCLSKSHRLPRSAT